MVRVRLQEDPKPRRPKPAPEKPKEKPKEAPRTKRGMSERQWFISLLVIAGLLFLFTFRGCLIPSGVGPKQKPASQQTPAGQPANPAPAAGEYTVQAGDTLSKIARDHNTTVDALRQANGLTPQTPLRPGDKLKIPQ